MKRRFNFWSFALYLLTVPITFILIGLLALLIFYFVIIIFNVRQGGTIFLYLWMLFMFFVGAPLSILSYFFVPPFVLRWIRKRRLRKSWRSH